MSLIYVSIIPLILGFILDLIFADPYNFPHPIRAIGNMIAKLEIIARKKFANNLVHGGLFLVVAVLTITTVITAAIILICYRVNIYLGVAIESVMVWYIIAPKSLMLESMKVYNALKSGDITKARSSLSMIVGRDTDKLNEEQIICATIETISENTSDGVIAPLIFLGLGGAVLGFFYKATNTMDSMVGYKNDKYIKLGRCAAKLDDFMNFLPSRISAVIMIIAAFVLRLDSKNAYRIWRRDRLKHPSPNSAQTESVCAGALGIKLGGDSYYKGVLCHKETLGDSIHSPMLEDIRKANMLMYATSVITLLLIIAFRIGIYMINFF